MNNFGEIYKGEWNRSKTGNGEYCWKNGDSYEGTFYNDKREGRGEYRWKNGCRIIGFWNKDKLNGEVTYEHQNKEYTFQMVEG